MAAKAAWLLRENLLEWAWSLPGDQQDQRGSEASSDKERALGRNTRILDSRLGSANNKLCELLLLKVSMGQRGFQSISAVPKATKDSNFQGK